MPISPLNTNRAVVDKDGFPLQALQLFSEQCSRLSIIIGSGSPEGVIEAEQGRLYMNTAGVAGAILYIKRDNDIAGNRKNGWILT